MEFLRVAAAASDISGIISMEKDIRKTEGNRITGMAMPVIRP